MATKSPKPTPPSSPELSVPPPKSTLPKPSARAVQAISEAPPKEEQRLPATLRIENGFEYHMDMARSVVAGILDPDVPDVFIEVPCSVAGTRRFLHTSFIKEIDVRGL